MAKKMKSSMPAAAALLQKLLAKGKGKAAGGRAPVLNKFGKGPKGKGGSKGGGKTPAGGTWMYVPARSAQIVKPTFAKPTRSGAEGKGKVQLSSLLTMVQGKGKGKGKQQNSKYMDKLAKIDASKKVWIGGLSPKTNWKALEKHVQETGAEKPSVTELMPGGKACLAFKNETDAESAISIVNATELEGKTIQADVWTQKEKKEKKAGPEGVKKTGFAKRNAAAKPAKKGLRGDPKTKEKLDKVEAAQKVWVGGLKPETSHNLLRKEFADAGHKPSLTNLIGKDSACLSFKTAEEASGAAAAMSGKEVDGMTIEVNVWTPPSKEEQKARKEEQKAAKASAKAEKEAEKAA